MSLKIDDPNNEGQEIEVFTAEELAAKAAEVETTKNAELATANAEVERLKKVSAEKTENFKKLNEMTEAEKAAMSAKQIEDLKRIEAAESKAQALEDKINNDTKSRVEKDIETALAKYHGGDEKLKEQLKKNFDLINLQGTDTETIQERAKLAADMEKGKLGRINPLHSGFGGSAPKSADKNKTDEFLNSEKAKAALKAMGEKVD